MPWTETESLSFIARHEEGDEECAERTLDELEELRLRLEERLDDAPGDITVVIHPSSGWLSAAHPFLPAARLAAAPAVRRYLAGWAMNGEVHVLNDRTLERRAGRRGLAAGAARHRRPSVRAADDRRAQRPRSPALGTEGLRPVPSLGLDDRGRRPVLRRAGIALPPRGQSPARRKRATLVPALGPRRDRARRHPLRSARPRSRPARLRAADLADPQGRSDPGARGGLRDRCARDRAGLAPAPLGARAQPPER